MTEGQFFLSTGVFLAAYCGATFYSLYRKCERQYVGNKWDGADR
jgi:hypothetical protein